MTAHRQRMSARLFPPIGLALLLAGVIPTRLAAYPIAGLQPDRRPEGAPVQGPLQKDAAWYRHALTGISRPYPYSLRFLEDQGRWYTPFTHPGAPPPYDLRGWHRQR